MKDNLVRWDQEIRQGRSGQVRREIESLLRERRKSPIPREHAASIAGICRRCGAFELGVRVLHPIVRPSARRAIQASEQERLEYGASLVQIGADREGRELLDRLDGQRVPQALLFGAFARFQRWEYEQAVPLLQRYVRHPSVQDYTLRIGEVNLLAALVAVERYAEAQLLFETCSAALKKQGNHLLYANLLGIWAQKYISGKEWKQAESCLESALALQNVVGDLPILYSRKWKAVLDLSSKGVTRKRLEALEDVRAEAVRLKNWETVRDCDYHRGRLVEDESLLERVYFGTPYAPYRRRIEKLTSFRFQGRHSYLWNLGTSGGTLKIDTLSGSVGTGSERILLKAGQVNQRLFQLLAGDFYRRFRLDALHGELFPDRYYSPLVSPTVMHQSLRRLKIWFRKNKIPLTVEEGGGRYILSALKPCEVRIHLPSEAEESARKGGLDLPVSLRLSEYLKRFSHLRPGRAAFGRAEFAEQLGLSQRSAGRYLEQACSAGLVQIEGRGPSCLYRLVKKP